MVARAIRQAVEAQSISLYRQAFEHVDAGLAVLSAQGEWLLANAALAAMLGLPRESLCGRRAHETVFEPEFARAIDAALAAPALGQPLRQVLETQPGPADDADAVPAWRVTLTPLSDGDGALLLQCEDLAQARARERREQADDRLQEHLAHGLSHDLRAPLRSIAGFAARIDDSTSLADADRADLARIRAAAARAERLVQALLELLRASRQPMREDEVDISLLCDWVAVELQDGDPARAADIEVAQGLWARGDEHWLKVLLRELFDNAWKFSIPGARVRITVEGAREGDRLRLSVGDRGRGFDMRYADKLFLPFQRLHGADQGGGDGLGLAIAQQVARRHGGCIQAQSQPGQGSTFFIELPAAATGAGGNQMP